MWEQRPVSSSDAEEAIHNREEELQAELQMTTMRLEEIKKTLKETKNVLGPKVGAVGKPVVSNGNPAPLLDEEYFDDEEDEFDETVDYDEVGVRQYLSYSSNHFDILIGRRLA